MRNWASISRDKNTFTHLLQHTNPRKRLPGVRVGDEPFGGRRFIVTWAIIKGRDGPARGIAFVILILASPVPKDTFLHKKH